MQLEDLKHHLAGLEQKVAGVATASKMHYEKVEAKVDAFGEQVIMTPATAAFYVLVLACAFALGVWIG